MNKWAKYASFYLILALCLGTSFCAKKKDGETGGDTQKEGASTSGGNGSQNKDGAKGSIPAPELAAHSNKGVSVENIDLEGMYHFQFRIASWNWVCKDKSGKETYRIKDGVAQKGYGAAYGWYYKVEKSDDGQYRMHRFMNADAEEFSHENQKDVKLQIDSKSGEITVNQTFEYGSRLVNTQDTVKMNGAFVSDSEIKGNYMGFEDVKNSDLVSCMNSGEYTMTKEDI
ncbi:MAG: hypothetical protein R2877_01495 [Bdellovibrionota bacterium]